MTSSKINLMDFSNEVLLKIVTHAGLYEWYQLRSGCKSFESLIENNIKKLKTDVLGPKDLGLEAEFLRRHWDNKSG